MNLDIDEREVFEERELSWEDLSPEEQERIREQFISNLEVEEERNRFETNETYPEPINVDWLKNCTFTKNEQGDIKVWE